MADGKIRGDEVACGSGTGEVGDAGDWSAGEDWGARDGGSSAAGSKGTGILETGVEEEIGIVRKSDILVILEDAQLDNGRGINRSTISARLGAAATGTGALRLL